MFGNSRCRCYTERPPASSHPSLLPFVKSKRVKIVKWKQTTGPLLIGCRNPWKRCVDLSGCWWWMDLWPWPSCILVRLIWLVSSIFVFSFSAQPSTLSASFDLQTITTLYNMHYLSRAFCLLSILSGRHRWHRHRHHRVLSAPSPLSKCVCMWVCVRPRYRAEWHGCFYMLRIATGRVFARKSGCETGAAPNRTDRQTKNQREREREIISV